MTYSTFRGTTPPLGIGEGGRHQDGRQSGSLHGDDSIGWRKRGLCIMCRSEEGLNRLGDVGEKGDGRVRSRDPRGGALIYARGSGSQARRSPKLDDPATTEDDRERSSAQALPTPRHQAPSDERYTACPRTRNEGG